MHYLSQVYTGMTYQVMEINRTLLPLTLSLFTGFGFWAMFFSVVGYYWWIAWRPWARRFNKLPGPMSLPILGCGWLILNPDKVHRNIGKYAAKWKSGRFWLGHIPYFITADVDVIEKILSNPIHAEKAEAYTNSHFLVGQGLVAASVEKWKRDRKIMLPCLKSSMFSDYLENFNKNSRLLNTVLGTCFNNGGIHVASYDIREHFARCMIDIVFETLLDTTVNLQIHPESQFYEAFTACFHIVEAKMFLPWIKFPPIWHLFGYAKAEHENMALLRNTISEETIRRKLEERDIITDDKINKKQLAHYLYHTNSDATDIFHQFLTVLAGGYDTTSTALSHTVYLLALNERVQQKLLQELDSVFEGDAERDVTVSDLEQLRYMELVLKESMRFTSPTPILGRTLGEDLDLRDGHVVPKGCNVLIPTIHVQHDPELWVEPETFCPERFEGKSPNRYEYLPFSGGPRGCFAPKFAMMSMKVLLSKVFRNFTVSTNKSLDQCVFRYGVVLHVKDGLPVTLHPRFSRNNNVNE